MPTPDPPLPPQVQKKTTLPPGILPRNTQVWFIGAIALLMVAVILFSDHTAGKASPTKNIVTAPAAVDPSQARIQEYRTRIDEQVRKLAAEQAQLTQTKQSLLVDSPPPPDGRIGGRPAYQPLPRSAYASLPTERSWVDQDREKREYQARFASNIALSYRREPDAELRLPTTTAATRLGPGANPQPHPTLSRRDSPGEPRDEDERVRSEATDERSVRRQDEINEAEGKQYRLFEGTVLEAALMNRLDGTFSGPVNCMVTTDVYSHNRQHVLIPKGSRVLGEVKRAETFGQKRLAVVFHRLVMPDGYSLSLDQFRGLNQVGETGLRDQVNQHYLQVFGVSIAIGAIAGLAQSNARYGLEASGTDAYRQGVASSLSQSSLRILDRYLNVLPTLTIREGHRVKIYLSDDILLPAYENHRMPEDI